MQNQNLKELFDKLLKTLARQRWWERLSSPFRRLGSFINLLVAAVDYRFCRHHLFILSHRRLDDEQNRYHYRL